jgi:hypothetical protein
MQHAIQTPLRVDLLATTVIEAGQSLVVSDVGKRRHHNVNELVRGRVVKLQLLQESSPIIGPIGVKQ